MGSEVIRSMFGVTVPHGRLDECIADLESGLRSMKRTPFHKLIGLDFLQHRDAAAKFIATFFRSATKRRPINAMYFEMNGFAINPDCWYFNGFGYKKGGHLWDLTWNTNWLNPWDASTGDFMLTGMEEVQQAFSGTYWGPDKQPLGIRIAQELAEHLVVARFDQLIGAAHHLAKEMCPALAGIPVFSTAHEWDILYPMS